MNIRRVLLAHNFYLSSARSGEDAVYTDEVKLLRSAGIDVLCVEKRNEDLLASGPAQKARAALEFPYSITAYKEMAEVIRVRRPQVAHFHGIYPQLTVSAIKACRDAGVPVVMTLHNYRLNCSAGILRRAGSTCELCWGQSPLHGLIRRCYRGSLVPTVFATAAQYTNRHLLVAKSLVSYYFALTAFAKEKHVRIGIPQERIIVKGNSISTVVSEGDGRGDYALFVGRLGEEKGLFTLVEAWRRLGTTAPKLKIVGQGPLRRYLEEVAAEPGLPIEIVGPVDRDRVLSLMRDASFLVVPSEWYEGFPLVIVESLACGTPVLCSSIGGLAEMIRAGETGYTFAPKSPDALAESVRNMVRNQALMSNLRRNSRAAFLDRYSPATNLRSMLDTYERAMDERPIN